MRTLNTILDRLNDGWYFVVAKNELGDPSYYMEAPDNRTGLVVVPMLAGHEVIKRFKLKRVNERYRGEEVLTYFRLKSHAA